MTGFYQGKRVAVCGGGGFLGSHVVEELLEAGARVSVIQRSRPEERLASRLGELEFISADLSGIKDCLRTLKGAEIVINTAAQVGGIQYNMVHPGLLFYANSSLGLTILEAARLEGVERFILTSSTCVYPREAPVPTPEEFGLVGEPERSNIGYGWAKRIEELQARFYAEEYGMRLAVVRPSNLYGPRDHFDPAISHVIPALIRRTAQARETLEVWGSGEQTRSFLYVKDAARALLAAGEQYAVGDPVNIGTEEEVTIKELVNLIIKATNRQLVPRFDPSGPVGQPRKAADVSKAKRVLDWKPQYTLEQGLRETVAWYGRQPGPSLATPSIPTHL